MNYLIEIKPFQALTNNRFLQMLSLTIEGNTIPNAQKRYI